MLCYPFIVFLFATTARAKTHTELTATGFIVPRGIVVQIPNKESPKSTSIPVPSPSSLPDSNHLELRQNSPETVHTESTVTCCLVKARAAAATSFTVETERPEGNVQNQIPISLPTTLVTVAR